MVPFSGQRQFNVWARLLRGLLRAEVAWGQHLHPWAAAILFLVIGRASLPAPGSQFVLFSVVLAADAAAQCRQE